MILIDAGPLVALADAGDQYHGQCVAAFRRVTDTIGTTWPALAEAFYLLNDLAAAQNIIWEMLYRGSVEILEVGLADLPRIRELMQKYADLPMDLADATLVHVAEREGIRTIFTTDQRDFSVYRLHGRVRPTLIP